jgi:hypothetical protein
MSRETNKHRGIGKKTGLESPTSKAEYTAILNKLKMLGYKDSLTETSLTNFITRLSDNPGPSAVGLVYRNEGYVRPILDVYVLWSTLLDLKSSTQSEQMDHVDRLHGELANVLDPRFDTSLQFVDPGSYATTPTPEDFKKSIQELVQESKQSSALGCIPINVPVARS